MSLRAVERQWTLLAKRDPYWAILAVPGKAGNGWDVDEFFATGIAEIDGVMEYLNCVYPSLARGRALDFGCGAGRVTQALARHFEHVIGIDISAPMIELARAHDRSGGRCEYLLNTRPDLSALPPCAFDFIYSNMTLQHMPARWSPRYLRELVRLLAPGGALLFQLPCRARGSLAERAARWVELAYGHIWWLFRRPNSYFEMHAQSRTRVVRLLERAGGRVLEITANEYGGPKWESLSYLAVKS
jgi:SAM-dependent methyltransferase